MSKIDKRIVEMQFDNKQFEAGVGESMSTLEALKKQLTFPDKFKTLDDMAKSIRLDGIATGVDSLADRFSNLGIVGMTALQNITNSAIDMTKNLARTMIIDPIFTGGKTRATNLENAKFRFEGLGMDVEQAMEDALYAVKGTAYGLDEAAIVASSLGASQVELGEDMKAALRGVSGVAAMTNSQYGDMGRIFTTVAGQGKLMTMQMRQIEARGVNIAAVMADSLGITESAARELVTQGGVSFDMFATIMDDAFGEHATKANETYTGSLSNMKTALTRLGASFEAPKMEAMKNIFNAITPVIDDVVTALGPTIDKFTELSVVVSEKVVEALGKVDILKFAESFKIEGSILNSVGLLAKGLWDIFTLDGTILKKFATGFSSIYEASKPLISVLSSVVGGLGKFLSALAETINASGIVEAGINTVVNVISGMANITQGAFESISNAFQGLKDSDFLGLTSWVEKVKNAVNPLAGLGEVIKNAFSGMFTIVGKVLGKLRDIGGEIINVISNVFSETGLEGTLGVLNAGLIASLLSVVQEVFMKMRFVVNAAGRINLVLRDVQITLLGYQQSLKADVLLKIAKALLMMSISLVALSLIDPERLKGALGGVTIMLVELLAAMSIFGKISGGFGLNKLLLLSVGMMSISAALAIMSIAVVNMARLDMDELGRGLTGIGALLTMISLFLNNTKLTKGAGVKGAGLITLAIGLNILASAVRKFGEMNLLDLAKGLGAVAVMLTMLVHYMKALPDTGKVISTSAGLILLGTALNIIAGAVAKMGGLDLKTIGKGLVGIAAALAIVVVAVKKMPAGMLATGAGLVLVATGIKILAGAMNTMGSLSWEELAIGMIVLAGSLTIMTIAMNSMTGGLAGAGAMLVMAAALNALVIPLKIFSTMSVTALSMLAGAFVVIGVAGALLGPITPALLALGGAIALIGVGAALAGVGLFGIAAAITALAVSGAAAAAGLTVFVGAVVGIIPMIATAVVTLFTKIVKGIAENGPTLLKAFKDILLMMIELVVEVIPDLMEATAELILAFLNVIVDHGPEIGEAGFEVIMNFLGAIRDRIPEVVVMGVEIAIAFIQGVAESLGLIVQAAFDLIISFINGLADAIEVNTPILMDAVFNLFTAIIKAALEIILGAPKRFVDAGKEIFAGFFKGVDDDSDNIGDSFNKSAEGGLTKLRDRISSFTSIGKDIVGGLIKGIKAKFSDVDAAGAQLGSRVRNATAHSIRVQSPSKDFEYIGEMAGEGMEGGIKKSTPKAEKAASEMAKKTYEAAVAQLDKRKYYNEITLAQELAFWENMQTKYKEGSEEREKIDREEYRVRIALKREEYDHSMDWISDRKYYNELSLREELAAWERVQARYKKGTDERKKTEREIYRVNKEMRKEEYDNSMEWIADRKYYNELSLKEELAAWERVQARYMKGTDERKKVDKEIYRVKNELIRAQKDLDDEYYTNSENINRKLRDDIQQLEDAYDNAFKSRRDSIYNTWGLFDSVGDPKSVTGEELLGNLEAQVKQTAEWQSELGKLSGRGFSDELISELEAMGPKSLYELQALNSLSDDELSKYTSLWKKKHRDASDIARDELRGMRDDTDRQIRKLQDDADRELERLKEVWQMKLEELGMVSNEQMENMRSEINGKVTAISDESEEEFDGMITDISNLGWVQLGKDIVDGIIKGIESMTDRLVDTMTSLANSARGAMEDTLDIQSPSRVFRMLGGQTMEGFILGISGYSSKIVSSTEKVGTSIVDTFKGTLSNLGDLIDGDMELNPTITPVLDLTDVRGQSGLLSDLLSGSAIFSGDVNTESSSMLNDILQLFKSQADKEVDLSGTLRVEVVDQTGEIVAIAEEAVTDMLRRESRDGNL